jgi:hypothetical protein
LLDWRKSLIIAEKKVFIAIDLNQDKNIDHDEWHAFKEAHGLKHIE